MLPEIERVIIYRAIFHTAPPYLVDLAQVTKFIFNFSLFTQRIFATPFDELHQPIEGCWRVAFSK